MLKILKAKLSEWWSEFKENPFLWLVAWWILLSIGMNLYMHDGTFVW